MAQRSIDRTTDLYHIFRFAVLLINPAELANNFPAGFFRRCNVPEYTIDVAEFREGLALFTKKQSGIPSTTNITLERGVVRKDTGFYKWVIQTLSKGIYKATIVIRQFHKDAWLKADNPGDFAYLIDESSKPAKVYTIYNAWPVRFKPSVDLDATTGDIAVSELEIAYEYFDVKEEE